MTHHDPDAEKAILGAILTGQPMDDLGITGADFWQPAHEAIWNACQQIAFTGRKPDPILVRAHNPAIDANLLADVVAQVGIHANTPAHATVIAAHSDRRWIADLCAGAVQHLDQDPAHIAERMRVQLDERNRNRQTIRPLGEILPDLIDAIERGETLAHATPWKGLDYLIRGFQPGRLYTVAARPGRGKSLFGQNVAAAIAARADRSAFVASLEMTANEYGARFLSADSSVRYRDLERGHLDTNAWDRISRSTAKLTGWPVYINDSPRQDLASLRADARATARRHPLGVIVIDYLQLVAPADRRLPRHEQVGHVTRGLKRLAKELAVPIVLLAQLNRESVKVGRRPGLHDLRESGDVEQDSDVVILLHDPAPDDGPAAAGAELEVLVAKNRNGPTGAVDMYLQGAFARIVEAERQSHEARDPREGWGK